MVKNITYLLICTIFIGAVFFISCKEKINIPPVFKLTGEWLPDTIYKNGYRIYNLDSLVEDLDDHDSTIVWSISSGPLLTTRLIDSIDGNFVKIEPIRNQTGNDWIDFTATDPMGARASKTCQVYVIEPICSLTINNIRIPRGDSVKYKKDSIIVYQNEGRLEWTVSTDTIYLTNNSSSPWIRFYAKSTPASTAVYFNLYDPDNHVHFNRSIPVEIY